MTLHTSAHKLTTCFSIPSNYNKQVADFPSPQGHKYLKFESFYISIDYKEFVLSVFIPVTSSKQLDEP